MQWSNPRVELLVGDFIAEPVEAVLPEIDIHKFLVSSAVPCPPFKVGNGVVKIVFSVRTKDEHPTY